MLFLADRNYSGIVFSPHPEPEIASIFDTSIVPVLETVSDAGGDDPRNRLIESENVYALSRLIADGVRADVVYADLPYNTGDASGDSNAMSVLPYIDRRDSLDDFEHSGWLSFVAPRVRLIRDILRPTGVAIFAIGRDELASLVLLLEREFGSHNRASIVTWQGGAKSHSRYVSNSADYMVVMTKDIHALKRKKVRWRTTRDGAQELLDAASRAWEESGGDRDLAQDSYRSWLREQDVDDAFRYYRFLDGSGRLYRTSDMGATVGRASRPRRPLVHPVTGEECPVPSKGWAIGDERMDALLADGRIQFGEDHTIIPKKITYLDETEGLLSDVITQMRGGGQRDLNAMIGLRDDGTTRFYGPKTVSVLETWIEAVIPEFRKAESAVDPVVVIDPFAGSASTGEAVARIVTRSGIVAESICITTNENNEDDNPEHGIARFVALPRLRAALSGMWADGSSRSPLRGRLTHEVISFQEGDDAAYRDVVSGLIEGGYVCKN